MIGSLLVLVFGLLASCGVVGPPIAPENVGVALTIEQQKKRDALEGQQRETSTAGESVESEPEIQGQDVNLPPLRPVGTR